MPKLPRRILRLAGLFSSAAILTLASACTPPVEKLWEYPTGSPLYSTPLLLNDLIVFGSEGGSLNAVDRKGQSRWTYSVSSGEVYAHPVSDGKFIFFGATNQMFYALDLSGRAKWQYTTRERIKSDPAVSEGVAYATSYDGHIYALKAETGELIWQFPPVATQTPAAPTEDKKEEEAPAGDKPADAAGDKPADAAGDKPADAAGDKPAEPAPPPEVIAPKAFSYAAPVIRDGVLYVGNLDGTMYAVHTADGSLKWRFKTGGGITSTSLIHEDTLFFGSKDDHVYAIDLATGSKLKWKFKTGDDVLSSPTLADGVLYIGSNDKKLYAIDAANGQEKCHFEARGEIISIPKVYKDLVFFGSGQGDGYIYAIERDSCKLFWKFKTGYKIESDPVFDGDQFYITSGDNKLYAFKVNKTSK